MKNKKQENTQKKFRINARHLFLTYPKCEIPIQQALLQIQEKNICPIQEYLIAQEDHLDGTKHLHMYLRLEKKIDITNPQILNLVGTDTKDVFGRTKTFHGNYQGVKSQKDVINYIIKEKHLDIITGHLDTQRCLISDEIMLRINDQGKYLDLDEAMISLAKKGRIDEAMQLFEKHRPKEFLRKMATIENNLTRLFYTRTVGLKPKFNFNSYYIPENLKQAIQEQDKFIWIQGQSGIGKTQAITGILEYLGHTTLRITDLEGIKHFTRKNTMILFDDVNFQQIRGERELIIHYLDIHNGFNANFKHGSIYVPPVKKIAISNSHPAQIFSPEFLKDESIKRRITIINLRNIPLFTTHPYFQDYMKLESQFREKVERTIFTQS
jgi:hypothetical protein